MNDTEFKAALSRYAQLLVVHGLNVQPGQVVQIASEVCNREFAYLVAEHAYDAGAKYVLLDLSEPRLLKKRILSSTDENLSYVPRWVSVRYDDVVNEKGANLRLIGSEDPQLLADLDPKRVNAAQLAVRKAIKFFYDEGIGKSKVHWTVAAASTVGWAKRLFPDLAPEVGERKLWEAILKVCRADRKDCLQEWDHHNTELQRRAKLFTEMKVKSLHFTGPGTDLTVKLSTKAVFKGGRDMGPRDVEFEPNIPTEEVFTTPDRSGTEGYVRATRPFLINGKLIKGLNVKFKAGAIVEFSAEEGESTFREYIGSDDGAKYLGEVALVGIDSPIYTSGIIFEEILFDENAACHIAVGSAYKFCIAGGDKMTPAEIAEIGCNESAVHTDMMISSEEVDVDVETYSGEKKRIIEKGAWVI